MIARQLFLVLETTGMTPINVQPRQIKIFRGQTLTFTDYLKGPLTSDLSLVCATKVGLASAMRSPKQHERLIESVLGREKIRA